MEVRFRPLQPSTLTRRLSPGQAPSEQAQSFFEVVESLTGAANNPEEHPNPDQEQESANRQRPSHASTRGSVVPEASATADKPVASTPEKSKDKPLGIRIDMTA